MQSIFALAALAPLAYAFTQPTDATFGALLTPDLSSPVTQGESYKVTWDATGHEKSTVSLVLCRGDSTNCVTDKTAIVEKVPAGAASYEWDVPCSLPAGKQATSTGYGMLIIEDGTGIFQYSTQFSVLANDKCGSSSSSSTTGGSGPSKTDSSTLVAPTYAGGHNGTSWGGKNETTTAESTTTTPPTKLPTMVTTTAAVTESAASSITWSTASQASATPAVQTGVSGAGRNAAGAMFLGAVGAAFLL
ncbi:uncharacterized protein HMPREF1541_00280 [Cyphellophora europaea CBS 101466]|uniref:Yeast cell wall synthesis Kre9/Knh1-like N-terminal domain-containing protein n=1 Tax=Cyphellophora europaea (strain CBS 101466) TaxID=1220924 RepID=W2SBI1_CYPE1|nr:uncharacterized protein HMPREF1541_00280 [Cyphellophora europaea CBS 101466]ETN46096.1 hypothetical protein HMPREF1541_00280 [Cyphellophora europaea CBS 101466]